MKFSICLTFALGLTIVYPSILAVPLVSDESIALQKKLTKVYQLKNGMPVIIRDVPDSDIIHFMVSFKHGLKDFMPGQKVVNNWLWSTMPMSASGYPKNKMFETIERLSLELNCSGGIEVSGCGMGTLNEYIEEALPLFAAIVTAPTLTPEDIKLQKERLLAGFKADSQDPANHINQVVNRVFYPKDHPFRLNNDEAILELEKLNGTELKGAHQKLLNASLMSIVVAGSMDHEKIIASLNKYFGAVEKRPFTPTIVKRPPFDVKNAIAFEARDIPSAYMRAKFNIPEVVAKDAIATKLMFEIFSEELGEEVRTKRSLSYSVHAFGIQYSIGIGVLSASTSKPQETLKAIQLVIDKMKTYQFTPSELDEYKRTFATAYFMTQETHGSLASAILGTYEYFSKVDPMYDMPKELEKVTAADIKRLAIQYLTDFHLGIIFQKEKFEMAWAEEFVKAQMLKK